MLTPSQALRQYFSLDQFRPGQEETIQPRHLPEYLQPRHAVRKPPLPEKQKHIDVPDKAERDAIINMLEQYNWHRSKTAKALGMDRTTLWRKIKKYGIEIYAGIRP